MVTTGAGEINWLEGTVRWRGERIERDSKVIRYRQKQIIEANEIAQRLLRQLVAQGGLSQENKEKIDAALRHNSPWLAVPDS